MYKVLVVSPTAKCLPGISTESGINSHWRVHYRPQVGYHNTNDINISIYQAIIACWLVGWFVGFISKSI